MTYVLFESREHAPGNFEVVERKGLGHPDTLCDLIAERCSQLYMRYCAEHFGGRYAHHWFDKVMLVGGEAQMGFGHGTLIKPYQVYLVGKAARFVGRHEIPLDALFRESATQILTDVLFDFNIDEWLVLHNLVGDGQGPQNPGNRYAPDSAVSLYSPQMFAQLVSNDGNLLASYAPLSLVEQLVLDTESFLQSPAVRSAYEFVGRDIKLFATRDSGQIEIHIRLPFIAKNTPSYAYYSSARTAIEDALHKRFAPICEIPVSFLVNRKDPTGVAYLTVTGSVADTGDVGVVGRGNRLNGLIAPMRPQSIEAAAGKNPIDHTGKLYSLLAQRIAISLWLHVAKEVEVYVRALKHEPIQNPGAVIIRSSTLLTAAQEQACKAIVDGEIGRLSEYFADFVDGRVRIC